MKYKPEQILIDSAVEHLPVTRSILDRFKNVDREIIENVSAIKKPQNFSDAKKILVITAHRGEAFKPCQGIGAGHLCCNYYVIDLISNCPMDCSYCILQSYIENNPYLTIYANIDEIATEASLFFAKQKDKKFRVGTGELSDSLALDHITGFSRKLIEYFAPHKHVSLELKTKTVNIDHLLKLKDVGSTVISWSLNPQNLIDSEENGTAPLRERLNAAKKAIDAGFRVGFHFDPIIYSADWEDNYKEVALQLVDEFPHEKIAWISLGTLRFPKEMKEVATRRFPKSKIFYQELLPVNGKVRYFRPIREQIYKRMFEWLSPLRGNTPVYLCMETEMIWKNISPETGTSNSSIEEFVCKM